MNYQSAKLWAGQHKTALTVAGVVTTVGVVTGIAIYKSGGFKKFGTAVKTTASKLNPFKPEPASSDIEDAVVVSEK